MKDSDYIKISDVVTISSQYLPAYMIVVSTNGIKPWFDPNGKDRIRRELTKIVTALFHARITCAVHKFEFDSEIWNMYGCDFIDSIASWNFDEVREEIIRTFKNEKK